MNNGTNATNALNSPIISDVLVILVGCPLFGLAGGDTGVSIGWTRRLR